MRQGIVIGLLIGLVAGYLLATLREHDAPGRARESSEPAKSDPAPAPAVPGPDQEKAGEWTPPPPVQSPHAHIYSATHIFFGGELIQPRPIESIRKTLAWAREQRDWGNFEKAILELGVTGTPEAHAMLVELMGDKTLNLKGSRIAERFFHFLRDAEAPGIVQAARARAEMDLADESEDWWWCRREWLSLVARHATEEEIAWLETLPTDSQSRRQVDLALAEGSRNPLATEQLAERLRAASDPASAAGLYSLTKSNPDAAFDILVDALPNLPERERSSALDWMGAATTEASLAQAEGVLNGLESPLERVRAITAVEKMHRRGLDVSGFQPLLDDLRSIFMRAARGELSPNDELVWEAISTARNRVAWEKPTLDALRALAALPWQAARSELDEIAKLRRLNERVWDPKR